MSDASAAGGGSADPGGPRPLWSVVLRSFLLQSVWNPRGMQNVGFCFSMLPILKAKRLDPEGRRAFLERHVGFFNTNPVLASYVLGAVAAAELSETPPGEERISETKRSLSGPLGMAGDALFWGALRPLAGLVGVCLALYTRSWAPLLLLAIYNVPHLFFRVRGFRAGSAGGLEAAREVIGPSFRRAVLWIRSLAAFTAGLVVAIAVAGGGSASPRGAALAAIVFAVAIAGVRARLPSTVLGAAALLGGFVIILIG